MTVSELKDIISSTEGYNFHTHTPWCDGHDTPAKMAEAAVAGGMLYLGFSPHSPVPIESPCNMEWADVPEYIKTIDEIRVRFAPELKVFTGMEVDYLHGTFGPASSRIQDLGLDFAIGSIHFLPRYDGTFVDIDGSYESFNRKMSLYFHGDLRYVVNTFYEASHEMLAKGGFQILGHADKVAQNAGLYHPGLEQEGWYQDLIETYLDAVINSGVIVEINTKIHADRGRFFPNEVYWRRLIDGGVSFMVNSDAHYAGKINQSRHTAFELLKTYA